MHTTALLGVAHIHTPWIISRLRQRGGITVKAFYDHDSDRAKRRVGEWDIDRVTDISLILNDPEITSVLILSETSRHPEYVLAAARARKHIYIDKPLAITGDEAARMRRAVNDAGIIFQMGYELRSTPQMQFIRREVAAGHLGKITRMRHCNGHDGALRGLFDNEWRWMATDEEAGGGAFTDEASHSLDCILWVLRGVCGEVDGVSAMLGNATHRYGDVDDFGAGLIHFQNGAIGIVEGSWADPKWRSPVEVHGTHGQIQVIDGKVFYYSQHVAGADGGEWPDLPEASPHPFDLFWDALEGREVELVSVEEAAEESRVMGEKYGSAAAL